jgi:8-oxo-dGTP pyrophosphatase MutT (NUDIX family)
LEREYFALIGGLFNEGETGLQCAQRELLEETGLEAEELIDTLPEALIDTRARWDGFADLLGVRDGE